MIDSARDAPLHVPRGIVIVAGLWLGAALMPSAAHSSVATPATGALEEIQIIGERPGPRLWRVTRGDHVLWILGTLNHLPRKMRWRSAEVEEAIAHSQQVLASGPSVSASIGPIGMIRLYFQWHGVQTNPKKTTLKEWLPPAVYARFEMQKARFDGSDTRIEELRPTFAALRLYEQAMDAAGLTGRNETERSVLRIAAQRHVPVHRASLAVADPSGVLKAISALSPSVEVSCLEATVARLETDLPVMQQRAAAWAVGDVDRLRQLSFIDQTDACLSALSSSPTIKALIEQASSAWDNEAEAALLRDRVSFAMRPIYELLAPDGPLSRYRAEGYVVEGP
ncbi:MAG: TraB/GumN family protein [Steroidobacteraceae bacterium]